MNIAFFTDTFLPKVDGVVTYVLENAQKLAERGHEVLIFAPKPRKGVGLNLSKYSFKIIFLPSVPALVYPEGRIILPALPKLLYYLRKFKPDIIHIQTTFSAGTEGLIAGKILKIPLVSTCHGFLIDRPFFEDFKLEKFHEILQNPLWSLYISFFNLTDMIICPTKAAERELRKFGLSKPSVVIPHGMNFDSIKNGYKTDISGMQKKYGLNSHDKVAIFSGRLAADKSIDLLIKVWKKVVFHISKAKLLIIGGGPLEKTLKIMVRKNGLNRNVIFTGELKREVLIDKGLLRSGQIAVSASKIENPSYSLLEEMAFGMPIVAFNMRGIPEIVDKTNGILVSSDDLDSFADSIVLLFNDKLIYQRLSKGAIKKAEMFSIEKNIVLLEKIYRKTIDRKFPPN